VVKCFAPFLDDRIKTETTPVYLSEPASDRGGMAEKSAGFWSYFAGVVNPNPAVEDKFHW